MVTFWNLPTAANVAIALAIAAVLVIGTTLLFSRILRVIGRKRTWATLIEKRMHVPYIVLASVVGAWIALGVTLPFWGNYRSIFRPTFSVLLVLSITWVIGSALMAITDLGLARYATDGSDGWHARRARTQVLVVRRLIGAVTVIVGVGAALLTIPGIAAIGTTVLASAGFLSVVAGLAAQSTLGNVFAGMQLAFSGAVRLEDVVVVDGEWGYIEELTLTYVVVRIWDERRLVLPSTYFTQQPYENWTRHSSAVLGTVYFDLDWGVDYLRMRDQLDRILAESDLWDGEASSLRITDTVGGFVQVRALISAADAFKMFDLTRTVREEMLIWLQKENPSGLPRTRIQQIERDGESFPRRKPRRPVPAAGAAASDHASRGDETKPIELVQADHERDGGEDEDGAAGAGGAGAGAGAGGAGAGAGAEAEPVTDDR